MSNTPFDVRRPLPSAVGRVRLAAPLEGGRREKAELPYVFARTE